MKQFNTLNKAILAAIEIAMDRVESHPDNWVITTDIGDGGSVTLKDKSDPDAYVTVVIGGALTDMDYPYYEIVSVDSYL